MAAQTRLCESCRQVQPASKFLPSSLSPTGYLTKCLDCIRKAAEEHRLERARIAKAAEARRPNTLIPKAQAIDLAGVRPVSQRLSPELYEAAKRFVLDFSDGHTKPIRREMEPELYSLLEWLAQQSMVQAKKCRAPEEVGRAILGYWDSSRHAGLHMVHSGPL